MKAANTRSPETTEFSEILQALKFELDFLEKGGYGRSVRTPWKPTSIFRDSPTCLNFDEQVAVHPCKECFLINYVPPERRSESLPCHYIPLNKRGDTVNSLSVRNDQERLEGAVKDWLRTAIRRLEGQTNNTGPSRGNV